MRQDRLITRHRQRQDAAFETPFGGLRTRRGHGCLREPREARFVGQVQRPSGRRIDDVLRESGRERRQRAVDLGEAGLVVDCEFGPFPSEGVDHPLHMPRAYGIERGGIGRGGAQGGPQTGVERQAVEERGDLRPDGVVGRAPGRCRRDVLQVADDAQGPVDGEFDLLERGEGVLVGRRRTGAGVGDRRDAGHTGPRCGQQRHHLRDDLVGLQGGEGDAGIGDPERMRGGIDGRAGRLGSGRFGHAVSMPGGIAP
jgi:hypothetical protein